MAIKPKKFKSAEEKRRYEENEQSWQQLKVKYATKKTLAKSNSAFNYTLENPPGRDRLDIPSLGGISGDTSVRPSMKYTGDSMLGISVTHKSNLVPVFDKELIKEITHMRR
jgi:hypothetical protein